MAEQITINILGKEYSIKSDVEESYAKQIAECLNQKVEEVLKTTKTVATLNILVLAAMNIANDYFQAKKLNEELITMIETRSGNLTSYIDSQI